MWHDKWNRKSECNCDCNEFDECRVRRSFGVTNCLLSNRRRCRHVPCVFSDCLYNLECFISNVFGWCIWYHNYVLLQFGVICALVMRCKLHTTEIQYCPMCVDMKVCKLLIIPGGLTIGPCKSISLLVGKLGTMSCTWPRRFGVRTRTWHTFNPSFRLMAVVCRNCFGNGPLFYFLCHGLSFVAFYGFNRSKSSKSLLADVIPIKKNHCKTLLPLHFMNKHNIFT